MEMCLPQNHNVKTVTSYIICYRRKNAPRLSVMICERNCRFKTECQEYKMFFALQAHGHMSVVACQT
jgi:putative component of membrane protein insertase Oxa1/YidC/SpoIIIJ protein YidD